MKTSELYEVWTSEGKIIKQFQTLPQAKKYLKNCSEGCICNLCYGTMGRFISHRLVNGRIQKMNY
jgi:hypothetical protein